MDEKITTGAQSVFPNERRIAAIGMVGRSDALAEIARKVQVFRRHNRNVLVLGESGTGKELVAQALHAGTGGFFAVNCASYRANPTMLESVLFGHTKGSFTGAIRDRKGVFEEACGGTVFLDEIHHLSSDVQVSILRTIQEKKVTRLGTAREWAVNFRLIAAAKPDLEAMVQKGQFRLDLYYRIRGSTLILVPLRERPEDIPPLVAHFTEKWNRENHAHKQFTPKAIRYLERYSWPGNVRELENVVYECLDLSTQEKIGPEQMDNKFTQGASVDGVSRPLRARLLEVESVHVREVLGQSRSIREAARRMHVSPQTVLRLMKRHSIVFPLSAATPEGSTTL